MKVGILGSGDVAKALAKGFVDRGHSVMLGTRDPSKVTEFPAGSFPEAARFGELIVLATLGTATVEIVTLIGDATFASKVVIDATNPLSYGESGPSLSVGFSDSLGEQIQRAIPSALVVKCFNSVGNQHMVDPKFAGGPPDMFICGNDDTAKRTVSEIVRAFGWNCIDLGDMANARLLEPMCMVWVRYGLVTGQWGHAFKMLRK